MSPDPILTAFAQLLRERPDGVLLRSPQRQTTVAQVDAQARALAPRLTATLSPGSLVTFRAPNGPAFLAGLLALRRAGAAAILLDARARPQDVLSVAQRMGAAASLAYPASDTKTDTEPAFTLEHYSTNRARVDADIAVVKMTSGSTGHPRGILTPAAALVADDQALARTMGLRSDERILAGIPFSHSYGLASVVMPALMRGSQLVLPEAGRPFSLLKAGAEAGATFLPTVPAFLGALLKMPRPPAWPSSLRLVISAGAPLAPDVARRFRQAFGLPVHVFYGSSESGGITYDRQGSAAERGTLGTPVEGVHIALDPVEENGPQDDIGRVVVTSPAVARSYWPQEAPKDPAAPEALQGGTFRTSDLGRFRDDELVLLGRADRVINVRGKKVHPREVETILLAMPAIEDAAVLAMPAADGTDQRIRAVVAGPPETLCPENILRWCRNHLAEHKIPRSLILVQALPRTARGKLDHRALRALTPKD